MASTAVGLLGGRTLEALAVAVAALAAVLADGPRAVPVAAAVGFFAAKSARSLRLAVA
ncbi:MULTISPECIES: hypothetical protein [Halobacterium]|uniref:hypothetical protein n=1 Tax=Halobacterium TaxID=2239 RepID=UPI000B1E9595|nr:MULTISPECIES: hypothetical protein [Halobacterium]MCG1003499.1 hypothetical protein [Halobacterium noricense]